MTLPQPPAAPARTCYRHPDRDAGRQCTRCGKVACGECLVQASVGSHCLDCAKAARPTVAARAVDFRARQLTPVTTSLIVANAAVFLWMVMRDSAAFGRQRTLAHFELGLNASLIKADDEWFRLVTSGFTHFGAFHLLLNMFALYQLGNLVERWAGSAKFALIYAAGLLGGSAGALVAEPNALTAGASGAVFGLLGAAAVGMHRQGINIFSTGIGTTLILNLIMTFSISGISIGGHVGGAIAGALCAVVTLAPKWRPMPSWAGYAAPVGVIAISLLACWWVVENARLI